MIPTKPTVNISKWFLYRKIYDPMTKCLDDPQLQIGTWIGGLLDSPSGLGWLLLSSVLRLSASDTLDIDVTLYVDGNCITA